MRRTDETLAKALGSQAENYVSLSNAPVYKRKNFAKNSEFYKQIMEDGYVFNPYIHRRWLPVQYSGIKNRVSLDYLKDSLSIDYIYYLIIDEINKMYTLSKYDKEAYKERAEFFTVDVCKEILISYCQGLSDNLYCSSYYPSPVFAAKEFKSFSFPQNMTRIVRMELVETMGGGVGTIEKTEITDKLIKEEINKYMKRLRKSDTYIELRLAIKEFTLFNRNKIVSTSFPCTVVPDCFYEAFWKAGAYYSIKHKIMFEHKSLDGKFGREGCDALRKLLDNGTSAQELHEFYMKM